MWRCGVAGAPVADWEEMYELADAYFKQFEEILFAGKKELFKERSPLSYVENIKVPLCIVQPQKDSRTPLKPVLRFVQKLAEYNKTFELHIVPDIGHTISLDRKALAKFLLYTALFLERIYGSRVVKCILKVRFSFKLVKSYLYVWCVFNYSQYNACNRPLNVGVFKYSLSETIKVVDRFKYTNNSNIIFSCYVIDSFNTRFFTKSFFNFNYVSTVNL